MEPFEDKLSDFYKVGNSGSFEKIDLALPPSVESLPTTQDLDSLSLPSPLSPFSPLSPGEELFSLDKLLDSYPPSPESTIAASSDSGLEDILAADQETTVEDTTLSLSPPVLLPSSPPNTASQGLTLAQQPTVKQSSSTKPHISLPRFSWPQCGTPVPLLNLQLPEIASPNPHPTSVKPSSLIGPGTPIPKNSFPQFCAPEPLLSLQVTPTPGFVTRLTNKRLNQRRHSRKVHKRTPKPKINPTNIQPNLKVLEQAAPNQ